MVEPEKEQGAQRQERWLCPLLEIRMDLDFTAPSVDMEFY